MRKKKALLIEVLLAMFLVGAALSVIGATPSRFLKRSFSLIKSIEQEQIALLTLATIRSSLHLDHPWNNLPPLKHKTTHTIAPYTSTLCPNTTYARSYTIGYNKSYGSDKLRLVSLTIYIDKRPYNYKFVIKKP